MTVDSSASPEAMIGDSVAGGDTRRTDRLRNPSDSLSVVVPARDEESRLAAAIDQIRIAAEREFAEFEVIIVNDGSVDATGAVADRLAESDRRVRVVHLARVHGLGAAYKAGLAQATKTFVTIASGDGGTQAPELEKIWRLRDQADMVVPYVENDFERPPTRLRISRAFGWLVNHLFGIRLRYHMHFVLYDRAALGAIRLRTDGYAFQAESLVKMIHRGHSYVEVGIRDDFDDPGPTRSYELRNILRVAVFFVLLTYDVYVVGAFRRWSGREVRR